jgi:drug/metabolite transporter (DMT)-like permease
MERPYVADSFAWHPDQPGLAKGACMATRPHDRPSVPPFLGIVTGIAAVSSASIFIRYAQREAPSLVIAAARLTLASLILAPMALARYRPEYRRLTRLDGGLAILSGFFLALHFAAWISSLEYTTVASSTVLVSTSPLFVAIASWLLLRENIGPAVIVGLVVVLVGSVIIGLSDAGKAGSTLRNALLGDVLAFAGAITVAGYLLVGRRLRAKLSLVPYIAVVYGTAAVVMLGLVGFARQTFASYSPATYGWLLLLALVPQLIGHSSFNWALAHLPATYVSVATLGEPIGSTILAYFILRETPTPIKIMGAVMILVGIVIASQNQSAEANS